MNDLATPAIDPRIDLEDEIRRLKKERNAVLLAHYYQEGEIQDLADFLGDSLQLAQAAKKTTAEVIVFCGVHFMAETAKILNPDRVVVVPDLAAGCSLADGCPADRFRAWRARHPDAVSITYINCSAAVKAESDYICTSSNAEKIVRAVPEGKEILFAPDKNLGRWLIERTGRPMHLWQGSCVVHETFSLRKIVAPPGAVPRRQAHRPPGVRGGDPPARGLRRLHDGAPPVHDPRRRAAVHRGDGERHRAPDAQGLAPQGVHRGRRPRARARATSARTCGSTRSRSCTWRCATSRRASRWTPSLRERARVPIDRMLALS